MKAPSVGENRKLHELERVGVASSREFVVEVVGDRGGLGTAGGGGVVVCCAAFCDGGEAGVTAITSIVSCCLVPGAVVLVDASRWWMPITCDILFSASESYFGEW